MECYLCRVMKYCFFVFVLLLSAPLFSQFNDSTHYYAKFGTTGIINQTNDRKSFVLTNALSLSMNKKIMTFNSSSSWIYGRQNKALSNNDFSSSFNADVLKNQRKIYYWALASFLSSYSLKINHQFQLGGGIGWNIVNKKTLEVVASNGIMYETSKLINTLDETEKYQTVRNSFRLKHKWLINNMVSIEGMHFWQPSFERFDDYIIRSNAAISVKLRKWLNLTSALTYNYISRTERENLLINFGLVAESFF